jgi:SAM-dependent methyltransferase
MVTSNRKQAFVSLLRRTRLLRLTDHLRGAWSYAKNRQSNRAFLREHPDFPVPPPGLAYDAYGKINWSTYHRTGRRHAQYLADLIKKHEDEPAITIAEWGCGPARVLRHMPDLFAGRSARFFGFDYNERSIDWCAKSIAGITFRSNSLAPPLPHGPDGVDCLFCISVFTHLSEAMHFEWLKELSRVVKPGGLIILTTHGDACRASLLDHEAREYDAGRLVVRGNTKEGKRCFVAYHPPSFVSDELLEEFEVLEHLAEPSPNKPGQDVWVVRNTKGSAANA